MNPAACFTKTFLFNIPNTLRGKYDPHAPEEDKEAQESGMIYLPEVIGTLFV